MKLCTVTRIIDLQLITMNSVRSCCSFRLFYVADYETLAYTVERHFRKNIHQYDGKTVLGDVGSDMTDRGFVCALKVPYRAIRTRLNHHSPFADNVRLLVNVTDEFAVETTHVSIFPISLADNSRATDCRKQKHEHIFPTSTYSERLYYYCCCYYYHCHYSY
jgi:hypothetical protein